MPRMPRLRREETVAADSTIVDSDMPLKAWKEYNLMGDRADVWLSSQYLTTNFTIDRNKVCRELVAVCQNTYMSHTSLAPGEKCNCGFHGVKEYSQLAGYGVAVEIDFYGRVVVHEKGYRAEKQRVLGIYIRRAICRGSFLCENNPELVAFFKEGKKYRYEGKKYRYGRAVCSEHKIEGHTVTLEQIARRLGIEVRWADSLNR